MVIVSAVGRALRWGLRLLFWLLTLAFMLFLVRYSTLPLGEGWTAVGVLIRDVHFDYVGWEVDALAAKLDQALYGIAPYINESDRSDYARAYFRDVERARNLEAEVAAVYADPAVDDPEAASASLRAERDALRIDLQVRQSLVESILEGQVAAALIEQGFGTAGQLLPPISMRFSQLPNQLVVSRRDAIRYEMSFNLDPMPVDAQAALEAQIDAEYDVASLIVPIGGMALFPAMVLETSSLNWAVDTFAHEWLHHYLFAFPLGYNYDFQGDTRTINETTASLFGEAIAEVVLARYYPEFVTGSAQTQVIGAAGQAAPFDYGAAMHETRAEVDRLLAEGRIDDAEAYMEARRRVFVANGYSIRKLNQAFFAFYGGYQSGELGVGGDDPVGPAVQALLDASPSIHEWVVTMRSIVTLDDLLAARDRLTSAAGSQTG